MKLLFLLEDRDGSANNSIAFNIINELSKNHEVTIGLIYSVNKQVNYCNKDVKKIVRLGFYDDSLVDYRIKYNWYNSSSSTRIKDFVLHPDYLRRFIRYKWFYRYKLETISKEIDELVNKNGIDAVVGVVNPYIIAEIIAKMKSDVKKYLFQLDPYSSNPGINANKLDNYICNEKCIHERLDGIFTTKLIINDLKEYNIIHSRESVVPIEFPVIGVGHVPSRGVLLNKEEGNIYFVHAGMFYKDIRNPRILAELFNKLPENYILVVAGLNSSMIFDYCDSETNRIIDLGCLSKDESEELKNEADFLISFNNKVNNMVPSKLFECIDSGKPFLNICQLSDCPTKGYVENYENACTIDVAINKDGTETIRGFVQNRYGKTISHEEIVKRYEKCTTKYVANQVEQCISGKEKDCI